MTDPLYLAPLHRVLDELGFTPAYIVEVGAGAGAATHALMERHPGAIVIAVDRSVDMLSRMPAELRAQVRLVAGDAFAVPLQPATADLVLAHNAPFSLVDFVRLLRPGGMGVVVLASAARIPRWLRNWCLRRAQPPQMERVEYRAGRGLAWAFRTPAN